MALRPPSAPVSIARAQLMDKYSQGADLGSSDNFNAITSTGIYFAASAPLNRPPQCLSTDPHGVLRVESNQNYTVQEYFTAGAPDIVYRRMIKPGSAYFGPWYILANVNQLPLQGKSLVCCGDSITANGTYPATIASRLGLLRGINAGFGGCRMGRHSNATYDAFSMYKIATAIASGVWTDQDAGAAADPSLLPNLTALKAVNFNTIDLVTIFYGTNDYSGAVPMGVNADTTGTTFKGAINHTVATLLAAWPHLKLLFVTPMYRSRLLSGDGQHSDATANANGNYLIEFVNAIIELAALHKIPALDLYRSSGVNAYTAATYLVDGLHPRSPAGYLHLGNRIAGCLQSTY